MRKTFFTAHSLGKSLSHLKPIIDMFLQIVLEQKLRHSWAHTMFCIKQYILDTSCIFSGQIGPISICNNNKKTAGQKPELLILTYPT